MLRLATALLSSLMAGSVAPGDIVITTNEDADARWSEVRGEKR
jgi:hypothetical protein